MRPVYIVDDDASVRRSTSFLLQQAGFPSRAFPSATDFLQEAEHLAPGILLLDLRMPEKDGFALVEDLPPALDSRFPIVMVTGHGDMAAAIQAMRHGVRDFLEKPYEEHELLGIVERLSTELDAYLKSVAQRMAALDQTSKLTDREREVLVLLAQGKANKLVAHALGLSVRTVEMHRAQMFERLGVRTLPEATRLAVTAGLLE
nr:response regulator [Sphingomonas sp. MA1305]